MHHEPIKLSELSELGIFTVSKETSTENIHKNVQNEF